MSRTARRFWISALTAIPLSATAAEQPGLLSPSDHGPAGVMADHMHGAGEFMVGYRYMFSHAGSTILNGDNEVSDVQLAAAGFSAVPTEMTMHMHMLDLMYAPRDWLTFMVMPQWVSMDMSMREVEGAPEEDDHGGHGGHTGAHAPSTDGLGDTGIYALVRLLEEGGHHVHVGLGLSAPTGSVSEKADGVFTHYMMQLGSGVGLPSQPHLHRPNGRMGLGRASKRRRSPSGKE